MLSEAIEQHNNVCACLERRINADIGMEDRLRALVTLTAEVAAELAGCPLVGLYADLGRACEKAAGLPASGPLEPCQVCEGGSLILLVLVCQSRSRQVQLHRCH